MSNVSYSLNVEGECRQVKTDRRQKRFESNFAAQYRRCELKLERILDLGYNSVVADSYSVIPEGDSNLPAMLCFFELISTAQDDLPVSEIELDILNELAQYSQVSLHVHAGFLVQFRSNTSQKIIYLSGAVMKKYLDHHSEVEYVPVNYMMEHGVLMPMSKEKATSKKCRGMEIRQFLLELSKKDSAKWTAAA